MGQKFLKENIGNLSESGGIITLAPSVLNIGGQQYSPSALNITPSGLTASSLYRVYSVLSSGVPTLTVSQNNNSIGPYLSEDVASQLSASNSGAAGFGTTTVFHVGNTFTTTSSFNLGKINITGLTNTAPSGTVKVNIYTVSAGVPNVLLGSSDNVNATSITANQDFIFSSPITLSDATQYAYTIAPTIPSGNVAVFYDATSTYAGGTRVASTDSGSSWVVGSGDLKGFELFSVGTSVPYTSHKLVGHFYTDSVGGIVALSAATEDGYANLIPFVAKYNTSDADVIVKLTPQTIDYNNMVEDNGNLVTGTGTGWIFTALRNGKFDVKAGILLGSVAGWVTATEFRISIQVNGANKWHGFRVMGLVGSIYGSSAASGEVKVNKGDTISVSAYHTNPSNIPQHTDPNFNNISISEVLDKSLVKDEDL